MQAYLDVFKLFFFIFTIFVGLFELRLKGIISSSVVEIIGPFILPVYFILLGVMIGYIIAYFLIQKNEVSTDEEKDKYYVKGFIIGGLIGLGLAFSYYFLVAHN